jgi:hypothetical protein
VECFLYLVRPDEGTSIRRLGTFFLYFFASFVLLFVHRQLSLYSDKVMEWTPEELCFDSGEWQYNFSEGFICVLVPSQPTIHWLMGFLSPEIKRPEREADK